nr:MAG TPA: hypothetical protein [Bacteriophage sp.]
MTKVLNQSLKIQLMFYFLLIDFHFLLSLS